MSPEEKSATTVQITTGTIFRAIFLALLLVFLYLVRDVLALIFFSVIIASAIEPIAHWGQRHRIPRLWLILLIYLLGIGFLSAVFYLIIPPLFSEFSDFIHVLPSQLSQKSGLQTLFGLAPNFPSAISGSLTQLVLGLQKMVEKFTTGFFQAGMSVFGGAFSLVLIIVISFYLSVQEHGIEKFLQIVTPGKYEKYILDLWRRSQQKLGRWLQGQLLLGLMVGVLVFLGLTILGIKYALMLALLAAIFELIPMFGPVISALPAVAIAFLESPQMALIVIALYVIIQQFESHLIYPIVVRKIIGVPSILVIIAMIVGGTLGGLWGILLAVPITAILVEFLEDLSSKRETLPL